MSDAQALLVSALPDEAMRVFAIVWGSAIRESGKALSNSVDPSLDTIAILLPAQKYVWKEKNLQFRGAFRQFSRKIRRLRGAKSNGAKDAKIAFQGIFQYAPGCW